MLMKMRFMISLLLASNKGEVYMKKATVLLVTLILSVCLLTGLDSSVYAADIVASGTCGEAANWTLTDDGVLTISGSGDMKNYESQDGSFGVIAPWRRGYSNQITEVVIEDGITSIGNFAFYYDCTNITSIHISKTVNTIGVRAFYQCNHLSDVYYGGTADEWGTVSIANYNTSLTDATIHYTNPSGYCNTRIHWELMEDGTLVLTGTGAMPTYVETEYDEGDLYVDPLMTPWDAYKDRINSVVIGEGITIVGDGAFWECTNLFSISFPSTCTKIGIRSFYKCTALAAVDFPNGLLTFDSYAFEGCTGLTHLEIPGSVTHLSTAFEDCTGLTSVTLSEGLEYLSGFTGCTSLSSINIPSTVKQIYSRAFYQCRSLTSITIPASVTSIGKMAFDQCPLTTLIFQKGDDLRDIQVGAYAFSGNRLSSTYYDGSALSYDAWVIGSGDHQDHTSGSFTTATLTIFIVDYDRLTIHVPATRSGMCGDNVYWSLSSTGIMRIYGSGAMYNYSYSIDGGAISPWRANYNEQITSVEIGKGVTRIGDYAFYFASEESLTINNASLTIGQYAFAYNANLTNIDFGTGKIKPGERVFYHADSLEYVHIPANVEMNGNSSGDGSGSDLFHHCHALKNATVDCAFVGPYTFESDYSLESVTFTNSDVQFYYLNSGGYGNPFHYSLTTYPMQPTVIGPVCSNVPVFVDYVNTTENQSWVQLTYQQIENDPGHSDVVIDNAVAATCEDPGLTEGSHCEHCGQIITAQETIDPLGHDYSISYEWEDDNDTVTATAVCRRNNAHSIIETVEATYETVTAAGCETAGVGKYTATFTNEAFSLQTKEVTIPATGHDWTESTYIWAADNSTVTASKACNNDHGHDITETVETTYSVVKAAGCEQSGTGRYTAVFANSAFAEQTKDVRLPATGHDWGEITYTWAEDNSKVTALQICNNDHGHYIIEEVVPAYAELSAAGCETTGTGRYTATFTNALFAAQTKDIVISATGHDWAEITYTWADDNSTVTALKACNNDHGHDIAETVGAVAEVTKEPTLTERGETTYTAAFTNEIFETQVKTVADIAPTLRRGDANGDGEINAIDRVLLARYLANWNGAANQFVNIDAMDINKDGAVNAKDRVILSRYLANWHGIYDTYFE